MANNNNNEVNITFKAFNADFNKSLKSMNDEAAKLRQEMKLQAEEMKHNATETEKLEAKMNSLQQLYDVAKQKTQETAAALQRAKDIWGESSEEVQKFEAQLRRQQIAEQQAANAIIETEQALESARRAYENQTQSMQQLQQLFNATGVSVQNLASELGDDLVRAIQNGTASATDMDRAFDMVARSALGASTDLNEVRQALSRLDDGGSLDEVQRDLRRLSSNARDARDEVRRLGSELGQAATAAGALGAVAIGGLVEGTEDVAADLAMLNTQITNMTVNTGAMTKATEQQLESMADGFSSQESALSDSLASRESAMQKSHAAQQRELEKNLDKQLEAVERGYEQQEEALENKLSKEYDAASKNYDKQYEALEKSLEKEVDEFEKASNAKIAIIDREYMERMKLIDEEKYNQLKALDEQINALNAKTEAEDRVIKQRENAEKRADLQQKIRTAKTSKERAEAQKDLRKFEEKLQLEAIREQRKANIDVLKERKDSVKESFDAQKDALKAETDARKEEAKTQIDIEKQALQDRQNETKKAFQERRNLELAELKESHNAQIKALQNINKAKVDAIREEQDARKQALSDRLSSEAEAVKASHAAELDSFKAMNAAKLKEAEKPIKSTNTSTVAVDFEVEDIKDVQTNFLSVRQDVDQITESMGNLIRAGYTSEEQLRKVSEVIAGSIISGGDTFNAEGLSESLATTTQTGELTGQMLDLFEKNLDKTGMTVDEFNERLGSMGSLTERANYVTDVLANAGMKDLFTAYQTGNPEIVEAAEAQLNLIQSSTDLANVLRPLVTDVKNLLASLMAWAAENPGVAKTVAVIGAALGVLGAAFGVISGIIVNVVGAFKLLGGGAGGGIISKLGTLFLNLGTKILPALRIAFGALTGPIGWIVTGLTVAVPLIIEHWDTIVEFFKEWGPRILLLLTGPLGMIVKYVIKNWDEIKKKTSDIFNGIADFFSEWGGKIYNFFATPIGKIVKFVTDNWEKIRTKTSEVLGKARDVAKGIIEKIYDNTVGRIGRLKDDIGDIFGKVKDSITGPLEKARDAVSKIIDKIKGFFDFELKFPEFKIPQLKIKKGSLNPLKWFSEGFPEIDIQWFANGGIMTSPTVFGGRGNTLFAGGEAGSEAILPLNERVLGMLGNAIFRASRSTGSNGETVINNFEKMLDGAIFNVREEADIKKVSREVAYEISKNRRGRM